MSTFTRAYLLLACAFALTVFGQAPNTATTSGKLPAAEVDGLIKLLRDSNTPSWQRADAAAALGATHSKKAVPVLVEALRYGPANITRAAAMALGEVGDKSAANDLCLYLKEIEPHPYETRQSVHDAIVKLNNPETFKYLFEAARIEAIPGGQLMAAESLDRMMGTDIGGRHNVRVEWVKKNKPEWYDYFKGKVGSDDKFSKFALFYAGGIVLALVGGWYVWARLM